ncbi:MAG: ribonuclease III [Patescibacteria group bacterium]|jgi:ribonuclease-3
MKDFSKFEEKIGVQFVNKDLLVQAFVHRSYLNEHPDFHLGHNERLEFLGDAVIELVVTEYLYKRYENPEGELTNWRASLVNANTLALIAQDDLGMDEYLYLSRGEAKDAGSKARQYILANAIEALIGSMYLDRGWEVVSEFIGRFVLSKLEHILEHKLYVDPKSRFQEASQETAGVTPNYKVLSEVGPDHAKEFEVGVYLGSELVASGKGSSKQDAQIEAARKALEAKGW